MIARKTTIRDVSKAAGVSVSTVSRVLNNDAKARTLPLEVREKVLKYAEELNYTPNANFRRLCSHRAGVIGLLVPSYFNMHRHIFEDGHLTRLISGVEAGIGGRRYRVLLIFNDEQFVKEKEYISLIRSQSIDGLLVWGAQPGEVFWREAVGAGLPIVFAVTVPGAPEEFNHVINATRDAVRRALDYFVEHGHRRILYLNEISAQFLLREMDAAVEEYRRAHPGIAIETFSQPAFRFDVVSREQFPNENPPTAILAYNYEVARGVHSTLAGQSIRIPDDAEMIACYGYGNRKNRISTMVVDDFRIGLCAVESLQKLIDNPEEKVRIEVPPQMVLRETTRQHS